MDVSLVDSKLVTRFWRKVAKAGPDDCWEWQAANTGAPWYYGKFFVKRSAGKGDVLAHRVSWIIDHNENIPTSMVVCHKCDNPKCVNPAHLFLGTMQDNSKDSVVKQRNYRPQDHGYKSRPNPRRGTNAKNHILDDEVVRYIRSKIYYPGLFQELEKELNVSYKTISNIYKRKAWVHVE